MHTHTCCPLPKTVTTSYVTEIVKQNGTIQMHVSQILKSCIPYSIYTIYTDGEYIASYSHKYTQ